MKPMRVFSCVALLAALSFTALPQAKTTPRTRRAAKPVTVTLVRWPYT
ncbi:MAG: hypothetical protein U0Y68_09095 [Blastocatellia bacterium]